MLTATIRHGWARLRATECPCPDCNRITPTKPPLRPDALPDTWTWLDVRAGRKR